MHGTLTRKQRGPWDNSLSLKGTPIMCTETSIFG
jgi:hypothetical protein